MDWQKRGGCSTGSPIFKLIFVRSSSCQVHKLLPVKGSKFRLGILSSQGLHVPEDHHPVLPPESRFNFAAWRRRLPLSPVQSIGFKYSRSRPGGSFFITPLKYPRSSPTRSCYPYYLCTTVTCVSISRSSLVPLLVPRFLPNSSPCRISIISHFILLQLMNTFTSHCSANIRSPFPLTKSQLSLRLTDPPIFH